MRRFLIVFTVETRLKSHPAVWNKASLVLFTLKTVDFAKEIIPIQFLHNEIKIWGSSILIGVKLSQKVSFH